MSTVCVGYDLGPVVVLVVEKERPNLVEAGSTLAVVQIVVERSRTHVADDGYVDKVENC